MSDETEDKEFFDRADAIIALANSQCDDFPIGKVSSSLLFAAARFNAFIVASSAKDLDGLKKDKTEAIKYFKEQYEKVFIENMDEYIRNYEKNIEEQRKK